MKKLLVVALLAALAPLSVVAHAAPKPAPTKSAMSGKMAGKKMTHKKMMGKKMTHKKMSAKKMMPMRDPKTGRFMKSSSSKMTAKTTKK